MARPQPSRTGAGGTRSASAVLPGLHFGDKEAIWFKGRAVLFHLPFGLSFRRKLGCLLGLQREPAGVPSTPRGAGPRLSPAVCSGGRGSLRGSCRLKLPGRWDQWGSSLSLSFSPFILNSLAFNVLKIVETVGFKRITPGLCVLWRVSRAFGILLEPLDVLLRCCGPCPCLFLIADLEHY